MKKYLLAVCCMLCSMNLFAQELGDGYFGLSYSSIDAQMSANVAGTDYDFHMSDNAMVGILVGYSFTENISMEVRGYANARNGTYGGVREAIERQVMGLGRFIVPVHRFFDLYAVIGYGTVEVKALQDNYTDEDFVYGVGMAVRKGSPVSLNVEWLQLYDDETTVSGNSYALDMSTVNLNLVFQF